MPGVRASEHVRARGFQSASTRSAADCRQPKPTTAVPDGWSTATALSMLCGSASSCMHRHGGSSPERAAAARACETNLDPDNRLSLAAECTTRASSPRSAPHLPRLTLGLSASRHAPRCLSHSCTLGLPCRWQNARPLIAHPSSPYAPCIFGCSFRPSNIAASNRKHGDQASQWLVSGISSKSARLLRMIAVRSLRLPPCCGANGQRQVSLHAAPPSLRSPALSSPRPSRQAHSTSMRILASSLSHYRTRPLASWAFSASQILRQWQNVPSIGRRGIESAKAPCAAAGR